MSELKLRPPKGDGEVNSPLRGRQPKGRRYVTANGIRSPLRKAGATGKGLGVSELGRKQVPRLGSGARFKGARG